MLKTCSRCGIVPFDHVCPYRKRKYHKKDARAERFRNSAVWQRKRDYIKRRDLFLCQACRANIPPTFNIYNSKELEVHHIIKLAVDYELRLSDNNLITLCTIHHRMADRGEIEVETLRELLEKFNSPPTSDD